MHIEPSVVDAAKVGLSYVTAAGAAGIGLKLAYDTVEEGVSPLSMIGRIIICTGLVLSFFEVFPHFPVGVSEVHFILGSTLFLLFGAGPAALGLALGLGLQAAILSPSDLPQYGMNLTTLIVPLLAVTALSKRLIPKGTAYKDLSYKQALTLSTTYQGGIVAWVAFWVFYGQGFGAETFASLAAFALAYMSVIVIEPFVDLAVLWTAKKWDHLKESDLVSRRVYAAA